ncbi:MAG: hypothetical protein OEZ43_13555 [Gammaproteobacteria bacterium]|nr:hypothetical protein [Gammaproteobacteria bacterium]
MRYVLETVPNFSFSLLSISGTIQPDDLTSMLKELWTDERYRQLSHVAWEFVDIESEYFQDDIFRLFEYVRDHKQQRGPHTIAIVAPQDTEFGQSRMFSTLCDGRGLKIGVFREFVAAAAWLQQQIAFDETTV